MALLVLSLCPFDISVGEGAFVIGTETDLFLFLMSQLIMRFCLYTRLLQGVGRLARKPVNLTSWVAVVTPTDRPKSVGNRCEIEPFFWRCFSWHFTLLSFLLVYGLLS